MGGAMRAIAIALSIAIPLGGLGAWAFNPDSGALLHSEMLWRVFGIVFEGGLFLVIGLVPVLGLFTLTRRLLAIARSDHA
jgi:hypothetical protein